MGKPIRTHKGWRIYQADIHIPIQHLPTYYAVKDGETETIEGVDLPDLIADIDEAEFPQDQTVTFQESRPKCHCSSK